MPRLITCPSKLRLFTVLFFCCITLGAHAQSANSLRTNDSTSTPMPGKSAAGNLFLHTDKNIYMAGERVWFAGYLLNMPDTLRKMNNVLQLTLTDSSGTKILLQKRFPFGEGLTSGDLQLSDSMQAGRYGLLATTNLVSGNNIPVYSFVQPMTILSKSKSAQPVISSGLTGSSARSLTATTGNSVQVQAAGVSIQLSPVTDDSLAVLIFSDQQQELHLTLSDPAEQYASTQLTVNSRGRSVVFAVNEMRPGVKTLTLSDSSGKIVASRLVYTGYNRRPVINLRTDSTQYAKLSPVRLELRLNDSSALINSVISLAVVKSNRVRMADLPWIDDHAEEGLYRPGRLSALALPVASDSTYLDSLLAATVLQPAGDVGGNLVSIRQYKGRVTRYGKPIRKKVQLGNMTGGRFDLIETADDGSFELAQEELLVASGSDVMLVITGKDARGYKVELENNLPVNPALMALSSFRKTAGPILLPSPVTEEPAYELGNVVVKSKRRDLPSFITEEKPGRNPCGDYVDKYGYLNYEPSAVSEELYQPVRGKTYLKRTDLNSNGLFRVDPIAYGSCLTEPATPAFKFPGIELPARFYPVLGDIPETQYVSTIFWKAGAATDQRGLFETVFLTGQLAGTYRIIVQGMTADGPVSATAEFEVR